MPSQESLLDQLRKLYVLANKAGLYDAADFIHKFAFPTPKRNKR